MFDYKQLTIEHSRPGLWTITFSNRAHEPQISRLETRASKHSHIIRGALRR
jgi:hypothetical protein